MTCANCTALRSEVSALRRELGREYRPGDIDKMLGCGLTDYHARIVLLLYYADDWVSSWQLESRLDIARESLKTHVYRIRERLGVGAVENRYRTGYRLSAKARGEIGEMLGA
jgi:biotin operon repressor